MLGKRMVRASGSVVGGSGFFGRLAADFRPRFALRLQLPAIADRRLDPLDASLRCPRRLRLTECACYFNTASSDSPKIEIMRSICASVVT
jgi:hypothetical protein